jgi:predicted aldo/keto reductase-like oxidoreductase
MEQVERAFAPGGVMEAVEEARKQGKVRFVGFTGHTEPDVHLAMLARGFAFDACQLPISAIEANSNAFVRRVLPELLKQKIAPLAMKTLGGNAKPVKDKVFSVREGLSYALTHPVASIISGITSVAELRENAELVSSFQPMSAEELVALEKRCEPATQSNEYQPYRKWMAYQDGDAMIGKYA